MVLACDRADSQEGFQTSPAPWLAPHSALQQFLPHSFNKPHTSSLSHQYSLTLSLTHSNTHTHISSYSLTNILSLSPSPTSTLIHTHIFTLSPIFSHSLLHSHIFSLSLQYSNTSCPAVCPHTHSHTHTQMLSLTLFFSYSSLSHSLTSCHTLTHPSFTLQLICVCWQGKEQDIKTLLVADTRYDKKEEGAEGAPLFWE